MPLGDLIRQFLEHRRRICEQKARYLDLSTDNFDYYSDHDQDERFLTPHNVQYFSNNLEPKSERSKGSKSSHAAKSRKTVTTSSITVTLPDGTRQKETVVRDSDGNEEKHITFRKNGKEVKRIIRKDPNGVEHVQEIESDAQRDSGYDFWFNKFFKPEEENSWKDGAVAVGNIFDMDKTIQEMMKMAGIQDKHQGEKENFEKQNGFSNDLFPREFSKILESDFQNEAHRFLQNFGNTEFDLKNKEKNVQSIIKKLLTPPKTPSMFEEFDEQALVEVPEDNTPLDKFIDPDDVADRLSKLKPMWQKTGDLLQKLDQYLDGKRDGLGGNDVYSDIENPEEVDIDLPVPFPEHRSTIGQRSDFADVFRRAFGPGFNHQGTMTATFIDNGKKRVESVRTNAQGETEKNITYQIGNKNYTVTIISDKTGHQIKREKSLNFPESELSQFKNQWSRTFHSDFND